MDGGYWRIQAPESVLEECPL